MMSSLRGSTSVVSVPPVVVPSVTTSSGVFGLSRGEFKRLEESLACLLGELGCHLPLEVGFAGLFFPFLECPRSVCGGVEGGRVNDGACKPFV